MRQLKILPAFLTLALACVFMVNAHAETWRETPNMTTPEDSSMVRHYTEAVDSYLRGLNEKDLEGILSLYAENGSVEDPVGSKVVKGMAALRKFYGGAVTMDLDLKRTGPVRIAGVEAAFPFELVMEVNGVKMKSQIIDVFRFDDQGKIVEMRAFWGPSNRSVVEE